MREVTETGELSKAAELYPGVSKVTVDEVGGVAYVFGRGNRATVVRGAEYASLVETLPAAVEPQGEEPAEVEPVEAKRPRGQKKESG